MWDGFATVWPTLATLHRGMIPKPVLSADHPDRPISCEAALGPDFHHIVLDALRAGWSQSEVELAFLRLAVAQVQCSDDRIDTDDAIYRAAKRR